MSVGTTGAIIGASILGGSSLASGIIGSKASKNAAKTISQGQAQVGDIASQAVKSGQEQIAAANDRLAATGKDVASLYDPFTTGTDETLKQLQDLSSPTGDLSKQFSFDQNDFENTPGYKVTLQRGQDAIQRAAAAQGGLFSTNTLKRLADYTVDTTNTQFSDAYNRALQAFQVNRQSALSRADTLKSLASMALGGTQGKAGVLGQTNRDINSNILESAGLGLRGAEVVGNAAAGSANATAAGQVGSANSWMNALKQGTTALTDWIASKNFTGGGSQSSNSFWDNYNPGLNEGLEGVGG